MSYLSRSLGWKSFFLVQFQFQYEAILLLSIYWSVYSVNVDALFILNDKWSSYEPTAYRKLNLSKINFVILLTRIFIKKFVLQIVTVLQSSRLQI